MAHASGPAIIRIVFDLSAYAVLQTNETAPCDLEVMDEMLGAWDYALTQKPATQIIDDQQYDMPRGRKDRCAMLQANFDSMVHAQDFKRTLLSRMTAASPALKMAFATGRIHVLADYGSPQPA